MGGRRFDIGNLAWHLPRGIVKVSFCQVAWPAGRKSLHILVSRALVHCIVSDADAACIGEPSSVNIEWSREKSSMILEKYIALVLWAHILFLSRPLVSFVIVIVPTMLNTLHGLQNIQSHV